MANYISFELPLLGDFKSDFLFFATFAKLELLSLQNKKTVGILAKFPDIRKEIKRFVEDLLLATKEWPKSHHVVQEKVFSSGTTLTIIGVQHFIGIWPTFSTLTELTLSI